MWSEIFPTSTQNSDIVIHHLLNDIIPTVSVPLSVLTDNGLAFTSRSFTTTLRRLTIVHIRTICYHPQSNGINERQHDTLHNILAKQITQKNRDWDVHLNQTFAALRINNNDRLGCPLLNY